MGFNSGFKGLMIQLVSGQNTTREFLVLPSEAQW